MRLYLLNTLYGTGNDEYLRTITVKFYRHLLKLKLIQKIIILLLLFTNLLSAQNVIIVLIDGARYTETFGGGNANIPYMYDDMRPNGYLYTNFRIHDDGQTVTNPGHMPPF